MQNESFVIERTFDAPIEKVWSAITTKEQMEQWYFDLQEFRPEVGFEFRFEAGDKNTKYLHICRITEVMPGKKLVHSWKYDGQDEETYVTWELFDEGNKTRLKLTHEGLERIAKYGPAFAKENFVAGWTDIVGRSLKEFVEKLPVEN